MILNALDAILSFHYLWQWRSLGLILIYPYESEEARNHFDIFCKDKRYSLVSYRMVYTCFKGLMFLLGSVEYKITISSFMLINNTCLNIIQFFGYLHALLVVEQSSHVNGMCRNCVAICCCLEILAFWHLPVIFELFGRKLV